MSEILVVLRIFEALHLNYFHKIISRKFLANKQGKNFLKAQIITNRIGCYFGDNDYK